MQSEELKAKVDEAAAPLMQSREAILAQLKKEGAVGVVVAVRGEIVWADLFSSADLLSRYWTKLVRSYAAESLSPGETHAAPTVADAQRFLETPAGGTETSEGSVGIYRYREVKSGGTETFVLESLLAGCAVRRPRQQAEAAQCGAPAAPHLVPPFAGAAPDHSSGSGRADSEMSQASTRSGASSTISHHTRWSPTCCNF